MLILSCHALQFEQVYHSGRSQWEEVAPMPRGLTEFHCQLLSFNRYRDPLGGEGRYSIIHSALHNPCIRAFMDAHASMQVDALYIMHVKSQ